MHRPRIRLAAVAVIAVSSLAAVGSPVYAAMQHAAPAPVRPGLTLLRPAGIGTWASPNSVVGGTSALKNNATGLCLDDSAQYGLRGYGCGTLSYQNGYQAWFITAPKAGYWQLKNIATGLCLDDSAQYGLRGYGCGTQSYNNGYQAWPASGPDYGHVQLENDATLMCLDDSTQYGLRVYGCNTQSYDNGYQSWNVYVP